MVVGSCAVVDEWAPVGVPEIVENVVRTTAVVVEVLTACVEVGRVKARDAEEEDNVEVI